MNLISPVQPDPRAKGERFGICTFHHAPLTLRGLLKGRATDYTMRLYLGFLASILTDCARFVKIRVVYKPDKDLTGKGGSICGDDNFGIKKSISGAGGSQNGYKYLTCQRFTARCRRLYFSLHFPRPITGRILLAAFVRRAAITCFFKDTPEPYRKRTGPVMVQSAVPLTRPHRTSSFC